MATLSYTQRGNGIYVDEYLSPNPRGNWPSGICRTKQHNTKLAAASCNWRVKQKTIYIHRKVRRRLGRKREFKPVGQ
eukprot:scaffold19981_cov17-Prasinocladus_malaysianus.AAC.1